MPDRIDKKDVKIRKTTARPVQRIEAKKDEKLQAQAKAELQQYLGRSMPAARDREDSTSPVTRLWLVQVGQAYLVGESRLTREFPFRNMHNVCTLTLTQDVRTAGTADQIGITSVDHIMLTPFFPLQFGVPKDPITFEGQYVVCYIEVPSNSPIYKKFYDFWREDE